MRILMLRSNPVDPDPRVAKEANALMAAGHQVSIIAWDRRKDGGRPARVKEALTLAQGTLSIVRLNIPCSYGGGISNLARFFVWNLRVFFELMRDGGGYDAIHACDFDTALPALAAKWILRKTLVYDIFDFYVDTFNIPRLLRGLFRWLELRCIDFSDALVLAGEDRLEQIKGARPRRVIVLLNAPEDMVGPGFRPLSPKGSLRLIYVGALVEHRFLLEMIELVKDRPGIQFRIAGWGPLEEQIRAAADQLPNVEFLGRVEYEKTIMETSGADLNFAIYDPEIPNHKYSNPNKVYEAMMVGRPVIVARGMGIDRLVNSEGCGFIIDYSDPRSMGNLLDRLLADNAEAAAAGQRGRQAYECRYAWGVMEQRLQGLYADLQPGAVSRG